MHQALFVELAQQNDAMFEIELPGQVDERRPLRAFAGDANPPIAAGRRRRPDQEVDALECRQPPDDEDRAVVGVAAIVTLWGRRVQHVGFDTTPTT